MSIPDLLIIVLFTWRIFRAFRQGVYRAFVAFTKSALALAFALLAQQIVVRSRVVLWAREALHQVVSDSVALPTSSGSPLQRGLLWLEETNIPRVIAQRIEQVWRAENSLDVSALVDYASQIISLTLINALCFVALFILARFTINLMTQGLVRALPPGIFGTGKVWAITLCLMESILICIVIVALLLPVMASISPAYISQTDYSYGVIVSRLQRFMEPLLEKIYSFP